MLELPQTPYPLGLASELTYQKVRFCISLSLLLLHLLFVLLPCLFSFMVLL
jgi:hypothetical protein